MKDKVLGFDLSSRKLAMVLLNGDDHRLQTWEAPKKEKDRGTVLARFLTQMTDFFGQLAEEQGRFWVFIEHPLVGRAGAHATIVQAQVQGLVLASAVQSGASGVYPVNVTTWKKAVVGHGGADKARVKDWVAAHHPVLAGLAGDDQDLVDATCVALYGADVIARGAGARGS